MFRRSKSAFDTFFDVRPGPRWEYVLEKNSVFFGALGGHLLAAGLTKRDKPALRRPLSAAKANA